MATRGQQKADLVAKHNLTQAMLNRKVEDRDISDLAGIIVSWDDIASQLLNEVDQEEVDQDGRNAAQKKRKMLQRWRQRNGDDATFDKLITAMLEEGKKNQATEVCKLLNPGQCEWERCVIVIYVV